MRRHLLVLITLVLVASPAVVSAQGASITVEQLQCLPLEKNAVVRATIDGVQGGYSARIYFRRLNNVVEDFYYVTMRPSGGADWWTVLPRPADHELDREDLKGKNGQPPPDEPWAAWWKAKEASQDRNPNRDLDDDEIRERASVGKLEKRDWMVSQTDAAFETWLESLENEPAEYYAQVFDSFGKPVARSQTRVVPVRKDCNVTLTPVEIGQAQNLTVGETSPWQTGEAVFHWLCEGIVTRIDSTGIMRADGVCRACVVYIPPRGLLLPTAAVLGGITTILLTEPPPASPSRP